MDATYWLKQTKDKPLFPDLIWSRPENKRHAGKLLIIGGNSFGFAAVGEAYMAAEKAGAGTVRVLMPDAVKSAAGAVLPTVDFAPSTPSGSFAKEALAEWLDGAMWADSVLLAGDLGRNSETAIVLETFLEKFPGQMTITKDAADYCLKLPKVLERPNTLLVLTMAQLQKLATAAKAQQAFTLGMDLTRLVEALHTLSAKCPAYIIVKHLDQLLVAVNGRISTTPVDNEQDMWRTITATAANVWWLQNPVKPFESLTTSIIM